LLNVPNWSEVRARLLGLGADVTDGLALVSVVGEGLSAGDAMGHFERSIRAAGATATRLSVGPLRIGALVPTATLSSAQRALHDAFVK
jgi:hypothetical protein